MSTIKDVAKRAGVSIATVSYVMNGTKNISRQTRDRVIAAIRELNYAPNQAAKSFKTGKKNIIAFIVPDISNNYFANIIESLEDEIGRSAYRLILANTKESKENEISQIKYLTSGTVDGIVLASTVQDYSEIEEYLPENFPVVLVDRRLENSPLDIVSVSDASAIAEGIRQLICNGHRQIGYIGDVPRLSTAKERLQAYKDTLRMHGITVDDGLIKTTSSLTHEAYHLTGELLDNQCTALVIGNNLMTVDACCYVANHARQYGDTEILGYQHKELSYLFQSDIGLIIQNETDMGSAAGRQILSRIQHPDQPQKEIIVCNKLKIACPY